MTEDKKPIVKRKIRRRPVEGEILDPEKQKARKLRMYFNENTEAAIVEYQQSTDIKRRHAIYTKDIVPAFEKLVENLINIYRFVNSHESYDEIKSDTVNFLFETIPKWDKNRGTAAFSYFNVVAKHSLIIKTKDRVKRSRRNISMDDPNGLTMNEHKLVEDFCTVSGQDSAIEHASISKNIINLLHKIRLYVKSENELIVVNSIITIFENVNELDLLNRSAIMTYMRELTGLSAKQLSTALSSIKKIYRDIRTSELDGEEDGGDGFSLSFIGFL